MRTADVQLAGTLRPAPVPDTGHPGHHHPDPVRATLSSNGRGPIRADIARMAGAIQPPRGAQPPAGALSGGGQHSSGSGGTDGGDIGPPGFRSNSRGPELDLNVPRKGYAWWYIDALSDDGQHGLTLIAFIGSVFSPYYFKGRQRGLTNPHDYCSMNVCLYGQEKRWTMTERKASQLSQAPDRLQIGPSSLQWHEDETLTVEIDEVGTPFPRRVRGRVRLFPQAINERTFELDRQGGHHWRPIAPSARVEVEMDKPGVSWSGHAYFDRNWGDEPIEDAFVYWDWSRAALGHGDESAILYNIDRRHDEPLSLALHFAADGSVSRFAPPPNHHLDRTPIWRMARGSQSEGSETPRVVKTLEDTPFYSRSVIESHLLAQPVTAVHESLSLDRFRSGIVQWMLPYRMPRR